MRAAAARVHTPAPVHIFGDLGPGPARWRHRRAVRDAIDVKLAANYAVCTRAELLEVVSRNQLDDEIKRARLVRVAPRTYCRPWDADLAITHELAAAKSAGGCALSHTTALHRSQLPVPGGEQPIHLTTERRYRPRPGSARASGVAVIVHRSRLAVPTTQSGNARIVTPAWAIVGSWPLLSGSAQRAPAIAAVRRGIVSAAELRDAIVAQSRIPGRSRLISLVGLIEAGCQSELELWGYTAVFDIAELRGAVRQRTVVVRGRVYRLDMAYEAERVAVELDGREFHAGARQWERDIARDVDLATAGWQVLRFSHRRLTTDVDGCRRDVLTVLRRRSR